MPTETSLWNRYCNHYFADRDLGFSLDISRVRFEDAQLAALSDGMTQAFEAMAKIEAGAIANQDEGRMVGHYWLRAPQLAPDSAISSQITETLAAIQKFVSDVHAGTTTGAGGAFENFLLIGIGGSALGPQFVAQALAGDNDKMQPYFVDNTDPAGIDHTLAQLAGRLDRTLVIVVSKSGTTPETRNGMLEVRNAYELAGIDFAQHAVAVTDVKDEDATESNGKPAKVDLNSVARDEGWLQRFPMWDWVGGRTSVTSAVGLLPAALQGIDIADFLKGAADMDELTRRHEFQQNPAALLAAMWHIAGEGHGKKDMVIIPYKDRLALFSKYLQQLVMESLGKEHDRDGKTVHQGIAVYGNKGSTDQHAYVQQLRDGVPNFFLTMIQVLVDRDGKSFDVKPGVTAGDYLFGFLQGTRRALYEKHRDSITITIDRVTPSSVGALIALYERAVGLYAELVNINAYHQPGVQAGKDAADDVLALQSKLTQYLAAQTGPQTADEIAAAISDDSTTIDPEGVYKILEHLSANNHDVSCKRGDSPQHDRFGRA